MGSIKLKWPLGIGTMQWGRTWVDEQLNRGNLSDATCTEIYQELVDVHNIQFFDTAEGYGGGTSEERLRDVRHSCSEPDEKRSYPVVIGTKFLPTIGRWTEGSFNRALVGSCQRLGAEQCDIYFIHTPIHPLPLEFWIEAAVKEVNAGRIKEIGISNCNAAQVRRACAAAQKHGKRIVANQVMFNLLSFNSSELQDTLRTCDELGVKIIAYSPIGQGLLTKDLSKDIFSKTRFARMTRLKFEDLAELRHAIERMAAKYDKSMAQICLNWNICHGTIPLVGTRSLQQAKDSVGCLGWKLSADDVQELDRCALSRSTLSKPRWRRAIFVVFISCLVFSYHVNNVLTWLSSRWSSWWSRRRSRDD